MQIKKLNILNLDELYKSCCIKQEANVSNNKFEFRSNLINLYNHIELTFILSNVTIYEYMLLKRFSTRCSEFKNKNVLYKSPDYTAELYDYGKIIHDITMDKDIVNTPIKYNYPYMYGPAMFIVGECDVTLSGRELISIFDIDPVNLFIQGTNGKCLVEINSPIFNRDFNIHDHPECESNFYSHIRDKFAKAFYNSFFISQTTSTDMVSDTCIHNYFSNHDDLVKLESVSNSEFKYNVNSDNIDEIIYNYRKSDIYCSKSDILRNTYIVFNIHSRFSTYIDLFEKLPKEFFISVEDLKVPANFREIYIPIEFADKYGEKLENVYTNLNSYLDNEHKNFYVKYQCTFLNSMYSYSIKLRLDDINIWIAQIDNRNILSETKEVINKIIRFGSAVLKMF